MRENPDIYYLGYYAKPELAPTRHAFPSAVTKMDYVAGCLERLGYSTRIVSASPVARGKREGELMAALSERVDLLVLKSAGRHSKVDLLVQRALNRFYLFIGLLKHVPAGSTLIVYHSLVYSSVVAFLKNLRRWHIVLEVEESYSDISGHRRDRLKERCAFDCADAFICSSPTLLEAVNSHNRPSCVAFGSCAIPRHLADKRGDGRIHLVYSGTFDRRKRGALNALAAAEHLDESYALHIIGFGSEDEKMELRNLAKLQNSRGGCTVSVGKVLTGNDYLTFLQGCHIGLSTQNFDGGFVGTSFPSKILVYLSNGLQVVSSDLPVLVGTELEDVVSTYEGNDPRAIAACVKSVVPLDGAGERAVRNLDREFLSRLRDVFEIIGH